MRRSKSKEKVEESKKKVRFQTFAELSKFMEENANGKKLKARMEKPKENKGLFWDHVNKTFYRWHD